MNDGRNRVTWLVENVAHNYRRSTSELQNDFCFNEHHSEKFTQSTYGFTNEIYRIPLDFGANWKRSYSFLPRRCLFPLTNRILQFKSFHRDKRSSMWNRLMRRNKANPRGLTSNRKRMCMRRRDNSTRRTRQAARANMNHVRDGRISTSRLHVGTW